MSFQTLAARLPSHGASCYVQQTVIGLMSAQRGCDTWTSMLVNPFFLYILRTSSSSLGAA